jgi:hypothetical protein
MNASPSHDPANDDSLLGALNVVLRKFLQSVDGALPARIVSYERHPENRAVVQPMVAMLTTEGATVPRAQINGVPVLLLGGGGHMLSFNLKPGDFGWLVANDRDISLFMQSFTNASPNTVRFHSFEDAIFIPDAMRDFTINDEDADNVVLQTLDGKYRVTIWDDRVKITADDTTVEMKTGTIELKAPLTITAEAPNILLNGNVTSGGGIGTPNFVLSASNSISMNSPNINIDSANLVINGTRYEDHQHTDVVTGGDNTGGVAP